ncbi:MAG TPA: DNA replication and repair protein RecF [Chitinophagaceae bacterium]|nr:DNA replication and repair protein RecF [Chitinophagaceae bacterium]
MAFSRIILTGYKNYRSQTFSFNKRIVGICGYNGKGKTNLLDAINYLCFTKSYFSKTDALNVFFGADGFRLEAELNGHAAISHPATKIVCIYRGFKKEFYIDDVAYTKFSHHIGKFPCVMIAPDDIEMITGGSEERRKFLDTLISQVDAEYLQQLIIYNKVLQQRNGFLKNEAFQSIFDPQLLDALDAQLILPGKYIFNSRKKFCEKIIPLVQQLYVYISGDKEIVSLEYNSHLNGNNFEQLLKDSRQKDLPTQRSNAGVHKDDITFLLDDNVFKSIASQGQRKSLLFACKLAEFEILKVMKGAPPLLLLDDVFEKLDELRMKNLLNYVCKTNSGQVFITDTHRERMESALHEFDGEVQIIEL